MAGLLLGDPSHHGMVESGPHNFSHDKLDDPVHSSSNWYFCRKEIEENSPSRRDGIDLKKETYLRKSYCTLLQDLGMRLKVPQVTIATAIIFCHRFFLRQSHAKNDRRTIATVCMFLAGKVEETPRPLKDVILVSYEIIHKKDPAAVQRIKQKEVYEQQKELIILGERVVLTTLGFDLNVHHPYKPLVEAIKKFQVAQNALAQVAWNFVNDGLRTSLCLQFKPHHIAAGAIFLAAKFLKVKLPSDGEKVWWQEFDVTPRQLEEVSNQMLELYEQNRTAQASHGSELEGSVGGAAANHRNPDKILTIDEHAPPNRHSHAPDHSEIPRATQEEGGDRGANLGNYPSHSGPPRNMITQSNEHGSKDQRHQIQEHFSGARDPENSIEASNKSKPGADDFGDGVGSKGYRPPDVIRKIDKDKVKAALEKRRKSRGDITKKTDLMDEDDLIERELESGVELAAQERRQSWSKPLYKQEHENQKRSRSLETEELGDVRVGSEPVYENSEEGELSFDASPRPGGAWSERDGSPNRPIYVKNRYHHEPPKDVSGKGREDHIERDLKRHRQENPV